jgi:hypothetical protein
MTMELYMTLLSRQPSVQITLPSESGPAAQSTPPWPEQAPEVAKVTGTNKKEITAADRNPECFGSINGGEG